MIYTYVLFKDSSPKSTEGGIFSQDIVEHLAMSYEEFDGSITCFPFPEKSKVSFLYVQRQFIHFKSLWYILWFSIKHEIYVAEILTTFE